MKDSRRKTNQSMNEEDYIDQEELNDEEEQDNRDSDIEELNFGWDTKGDAYEPTENEALLDEFEDSENAKKQADEQRRIARAENKTINYVNAPRMLELIEEYYKTDVMSDELALDIKKICDRLMTSGRFCNYTYRDEMAEDAFVKAYEAIYYKKFNLNKGYSPFSYLTQIAFHAAQARIKCEKKERAKCLMFSEDNYELIKDKNSGVEAEDEEWN